MRISGHVIGARATTATRRSVIFRSDGLELMLTFCGYASSVSPAHRAPLSAPVAFLMKERRPKPIFPPTPLSSLQSRLHHGASITHIERIGGIRSAARILGTKIG